MAVAKQADNTALDAAVRNASYHLSEWHVSLPNYMRDTPANLARYASEGQSCEILHTASADPDCKALHNIVGHILVILSTI